MAATRMDRKENCRTNERGAWDRPLRAGLADGWRGGGPRREKGEEETCSAIRAASLVLT